MTDPHRDPPRGSYRTGLSVAGIVISVIFILCSLAIVGFGILATVGLNNWAANK
jgi:hypothetical protein